MKPYAHEHRRGGSSWKTKKLSTKHDVYHPARKGFINQDEVPDTSAGGHSRPSAKRTIRNAKRAQKKSARQRLKRDIQAE